MTVTRGGGGKGQKARRKRRGAPMLWCVPLASPFPSQWQSRQCAKCMCMCVQKGGGASVETAYNPPIGKTTTAKKRQPKNAFQLFLRQQAAGGRARHRRHIGADGAARCCVASSSSSSSFFTRPPSRQQRRADARRLQGDVQQLVVDLLLYM